MWQPSETRGLGTSAGHSPDSEDHQFNSADSQHFESTTDFLFFSTTIFKPCHCFSNCTTQDDESGLTHKHLPFPLRPWLFIPSPKNVNCSSSSFRLLEDFFSEIIVIQQWTMSGEIRTEIVFSSMPSTLPRHSYSSFPSATAT